MTIVPAIRTKILTLSAVTAIASTRVWSLAFPTNATFPAVRITEIDKVEVMHLRGPQGFWRARVQIDCAAGKESSDPYGTARSLAAAVRGNFTGGGPTGLLGWSGTSAGVDITGVEHVDTREFFEGDERNVATVSADYYVYGKGLVA